MNIANSQNLTKKELSVIIEESSMFLDFTRCFNT